MNENPTSKPMYTFYPEGKFQKFSIEIGETSKEQLLAALSQKNMLVSEYAEKLMKSEDFQITPNKEHINLISLAVGNLGFLQGATTDEIYTKALSLGLKLCPAEVGPQLRIDYTGKDWMYIGMQQIISSEAGGDVFCLVVNEIEDRLELGAVDGSPNRIWNSDFNVVFRIQSVSTIS
jgi:hypothetical protein